MLGWVDRAVAANRVGGVAGGNDYWLDTAETADRYYAVGRGDDGLLVMSDAFARSPERGGFTGSFDFFRSTFCACASDEIASDSISVVAPR